jgi:hypothetical protein
LAVAPESSVFGLPTALPPTGIVPGGTVAPDGTVGTGNVPAGIVPGGCPKAKAFINQQHEIHATRPASGRGMVRTAWMIIRDGTSDV